MKLSSMIDHHSVSDLPSASTSTYALLSSASSSLPLSQFRSSSAYPTSHPAYSASHPASHPAAYHFPPPVSTISSADHHHKLPSLPSHLPAFPSSSVSQHAPLPPASAPVPTSLPPYSTPAQHHHTSYYPSQHHYQNQQHHEPHHTTYPYSARQRSHLQPIPNILPSHQLVESDHSRYTSQPPLPHEPIHHQQTHHQPYQQPQQHRHSYLSSTIQDTSPPPASRHDRIAPLSLPLSAAKTVYADAPAVLFDSAGHPTVSPVSVAQVSDPTYCVSPVSNSHPPEHLPPAASSIIRTDNRVLPSSIDDSLIARLRGFNGPAPPRGQPLRAAPFHASPLAASHPPLSVSASVKGAAPRSLPVPPYAAAGSAITSLMPISRGEPQIRDTSESLAVGYADNSAIHQRDMASYAPQMEKAAVSPDRPHACRKCSAAFVRRDNLMAHIRAQHKGERPFKCEVCGFRFIKKDHAMKHWKVVHLKERPFVCGRCDSRFGQRSDLNKHVRSVHLRIKPFECEHCGLRFSHRGNQIRHQAVVHEKKKPFTCTECSSSFAEKSNLLKHCQAVHKAEASFPSQ